MSRNRKKKAYDSSHITPTIRLHQEIYNRWMYVKISFKNSILAIWNQLTRKGAWRNIFVTHNAFGIFSEYSHISRRSGKPKIPYPNKKVALRAAEAMGKKHGVHFSVYKCAWCDGWHIGKNAQNKIKSDALENKALVSEDANKCLMFDY